MNILIPLGLVLLVSWLIARFSHRLRLPAVVGYLLMGLFLGPSVLDLFNENTLDTLHLLNDSALAVIAFVIGREIHLNKLRKKGTQIITITLFQQAATVVIVALGVYCVSRNMILSLLLGALASASAPAGTAIVLQENNAKGPLTETLYSIVGIDDALAIMIYAFVVAFSHFWLESGANQFHSFMIAFKEIGGSLILGAILGMLLGNCTRKVRKKADVLELILGTIIFSTGLSLYFEFSLILTNLIIGIVISNFFKDADQKMKEPLELISLPVYVLFFILAGAHLQLSLLPSLGAIGLIYILCRMIGKIGGAYVGGVLSRAKTVVKKYTGMGILSQAGVAIGLAVSLNKTYPELTMGEAHIAQTILNIIVGSTIIFEILGPIGVQFAVNRARETQNNS
jgi:Kef-type K+ transport system membrane component KefB